MDELTKIVEEYKKKYDDFNLFRSIEVYLAKRDSILYFEENENYIRVFPKNGSHYIDFIVDYGVDERLFIAFKKLYDIGLTNYVEKLCVHEGTLRVSVKKMYTIKEVQKEFDKHFGGSIDDINEDCWNYEFFDKL